MIVSPRQSRPAEITGLATRTIALVLAVVLAFACSDRTDATRKADRQAAWAAPFGLSDARVLAEFGTGDADEGGDTLGRVPYVCIGDESIVLWAAAVPETDSDGNRRTADALDTPTWTGANALILTDLLTGCSRLVDNGETGRYAWLTVGPHGKTVGFQYQRTAGGSSRNDSELRRLFTVRLDDVFAAAAPERDPELPELLRPELPYDLELRVVLMDALAERLGDNAHRRNLITIGFREDGTYGESWLRFTHDGQLLHAAIGQRRVFKPRKGKHQALYGFAADGTRNAPVFEVQGPIVDADVFAPMQHPIGGGVLCLIDYPGDRSQALLHLSTTPLERENMWAPPVLVYAPEHEGAYSEDIDHDPLFTEWLTAVRGHATLLCQVGLNNRLSIVAIDLEQGRAQLLSAGSEARSHAHPALAPGARCYACEVWEIGSVDVWDRAPVRAFATELRNAATDETLLRVENACFPHFVQEGTGMVCLVRIEDIDAYASVRDESAELKHLRWRPRLIETNLTAEDLGVLSAQRRAEVLALIAQLADDDGAVRDRADFLLRNAGRTILPMLTEHLQLLPADADAELRGRLEAVIAYHSKAPPPPPPWQRDGEDDGGDDGDDNGDDNGD